jgi:hypothetical protein
MEDAKISVRRALGIKGLDKLFSSKEFIGPELLEPYVKDNSLVINRILDLGHFLTQLDSDAELGVSGFFSGEGIDFIRDDRVGFSFYGKVVPFVVIDGENAVVRDYFDDSLRELKKIQQYTKSTIFRSDRFDVRFGDDARSGRDDEDIGNFWIDVAEMDASRYSKEMTAAVVFSGNDRKYVKDGSFEVEHKSVNLDRDFSKP